jgi:hypothetical protein
MLRYFSSSVACHKNYAIAIAASLFKYSGGEIGTIEICFGSGIAWGRMFFRLALVLIFRTNSVSPTFSTPFYTVI